MEKQSNINDLLWTLLWAGCVPVAFWGRSVKIKLTEIALKRPQNGPKTTETSWNISTQKMESYPKSAIAEDDLQNAYYNIQEREIVWTHACQSKLSKTIK